MSTRIKRLCKLALVLALSNTAACGYLIYPERQGLRGDRVDGTVVALDAIGLLFFVLPGVVAFAVDFSSGCIYLPESQQGSFSLNTPALEHPAPAGWVEVAQVAPFADEATIVAALREHLRANGQDASAARVEWQPTPIYTAKVVVN